MPFDLRYAGLDPATAQRFRLAANALAAHRVQARATEWDGTRCDVVAADPDDEYGRRVLEIARRRGTPALEIGAAIGSAEPGTSVARLTRALFELLCGADDPPATPQPAAASRTSACGLVKLVNTGGLAGKNIEARWRNVTVWLLPGTGRVLSATVSDQLRARERLGSDSDWTFIALEDPPRRAPPGEISTSLDAFLLHATWQVRAQLPPFPATAVSLRDWPDLGAAATLLEPLAVVRALQRGALTPAELARRTGVADQDVGACLWAFAASGLLHDGRPAATPPAPSPSSGLFSRLAAHFGLRRP